MAPAQAAPVGPEQPVDRGFDRVTDTDASEVQ